MGVPHAREVGVAWCLACLVCLPASDFCRSFLASSASRTVEQRESRKRRSQPVRASVWKTACRGGKYTTSNCPIRDPPTAYRNIRLDRIPSDSTDLVCE